MKRDIRGNRYSDGSPFLRFLFIRIIVGSIQELWMEEILQVGVITSTHGIKGEVKIFPMTDDVKRFDCLKEIILDTGKEKKTLSIEGVKYFKQFVILKFKGIDSINDIEIYKGKPLFVTRDQAVPLEEDEYFVADLIGFEVVEEETGIHGTLLDVMETGANDVYIIKLSDNRELLLPAIKQCILSVDMNTRLMKIHILEGLL